MEVGRGVERQDKQVNYMYVHQKVLRMPEKKLKVA